MLDVRDDKGISRKEYLQQRAKSTGKVPPELRLPPFPDTGAYLWEMYIDLHRGRSRDMAGDSPLSWVDIQAWCNLRGKALSSEELDVILEIDREWINAK